MRNGRFREDLWYRLNVFTLTLPPLAQRKGDLPLLIQTFVRRFCQRMGKPELAIPNAVIQTLMNHDWPGNVRELQNVIEHAVLVSDGKHLRLDTRLMEIAKPNPGATGRLKTMEEVERQHILSALEATSWKVGGKGGAAELLDMKRTTLISRIEKLNISKP